MSSESHKGSRRWDFRAIESRLNAAHVAERYRMNDAGHEKAAVRTRSRDTQAEFASGAESPRFDRRLP